MKKLIVILFLVEVLLPIISPPLSGQPTEREAPQLNLPHAYSQVGTDMEEAVLAILDAKCNVCHKRQNPFRVFKSKNLDKNAPKIKEQVFVKKRMPKGDEIKLTEQELNTLNTWLTTKNL